MTRINISYAILAVGWLLGLWLAADLGARSAQRRLELDTARQHLAKYQAIAALTPRIEATYQTYAGVFQPQEPQPAGAQAFMEQLEGCADGSMQLNLKPQALRSQAKDIGTKQIGVEVELETTQQGVMAFLDRLFALPSLVELERFQVAASASAEYPLKASLLVSKHEL